ncbi:MAG: VWA domain-containing protein [bacterium]
MRFSYPIFVLLFIVLGAIIVFYYINWRKKKRLLYAFVSEAISKKLISSEVFNRQIYKIILIVTALFFIIIALIGPRVGMRLTEIRRRGVDVIIAVDCSKSMLAEDYFPNRLRMAKNELNRFINGLEGDRIGIIAFAGQAFVQCPLTLDYSAAKMFLGLVDTSLIPKGGTSLGSAIKVAIKSFSQKERKYKVLVLLTDGEDHEGNVIELASEAKKEGIIIFPVGIGKPEGEVIPIRDDQGNLMDYQKDRSGNIITTKLDEETLKKIALETGGKYYRSTQAGLEIENIIGEIDDMDKKELSSRLLNQFENRYQFFLMIGIILLFIEFFIPEEGNPLKLLLRIKKG